MFSKILIPHHIPVLCL